MYFDYVIVGAGYAGAVTARRLVDEKNANVLIVERKNHVGGQAYDELDNSGLIVQRYGAHIFHTSNACVWQYLSRFTQWNMYQHRVLAYVDGMYIPLPVSAETINQLYNMNLTPNEVEVFLKSQAVEIPNINTSEDVVLAGAGKYIYEKFFKNYTFKQWDKYPSELDASVISRLPIRTSRDTRYFTDKYQGLPSRGYAKMFENILRHNNIKLLLNCDWNEIKNDITYSKLIYTGPVDAYFDYKLGKLEYRSVYFEYETYFDREYYQDVAVVNYPNDYDFTRIIEFKRLTAQKAPHTTIAKEYSSSTGDPYYTIPDAKNRTLSEKYAALAAGQQNTIFIGRLAEYKYYNMDQIVERALNLQL